MLDEGEVDWSSSDTGIVSLEPTGSRSARAVANGPGMATIEVTHGELRAGSTIDVENLATGLREVTGSGQEGAAGEVLPEEPSPTTAASPSPGPPLSAAVSSLCTFGKSMGRPVGSPGRGALPGRLCIDGADPRSPDCEGVRHWCRWFQACYYCASFPGSALA